MYCPKLRVSGSTYQECDGDYTINEYKPGSPPKFKKPGYDRYIYYDSKNSGWKIGSHHDMDTESWYFRKTLKGKSGNAKRW